MALTIRTEECNFKTLPLKSSPSSYVTNLMKLYDMAVKNTERGFKSTERR
jgi:hypothetical protein